MSLVELKNAFEQIGLSSELGYRPALFDQESLTELYVCKLHGPNHFILIRNFDSTHVEIFDELDRPRKVLKSKLSRRFKGFCLILHDSPNPIKALANDLTGPLPQFDTLLKDAGELEFRHFADKPIPFEFSLTNVGASPLALVNVHVTCDCTHVTYPKTPIKPGESGLLKIAYNSRLGDTDGNFSKEVFLETNSKEFRFICLRVSGEIPGRMTCFPRRVEMGVIAKGKIGREFLIVDVPRTVADVSEVTAGLVENDLANLVSISGCEINRVNQVLSSRDENFIPISLRPGLRVFEISIDPEEQDLVFGKMQFSIEISHKDDLLAPVFVEVNANVLKQSSGN